MFGDTTIGEIIGVGIAAAFVAFVHYRVTTRRDHMRLAAGILESDDVGIVSELERLVAPDKAVPAVSRAGTRARKLARA